MFHNFMLHFFFPVVSCCQSFKCVLFLYKPFLYLHFFVVLWHYLLASCTIFESIYFALF